MRRAKTLRIGYFGDGPWAHDALRLLLADRNLKVVFVAPRFQSPDPVLASIAREAGVELFRESSVNSPASLGKIRSYEPDLLVSMSYDQIIRKPLIEAAPLGFINCHAGKLPFYRGRNILNWALINGEKEFGITVHFIDEGIDTGPIIEQERVPIRPEDDYASVLLKAQERCGKVLYRAVDKLRRGPVKPKVQSKIHPVGFYCGRRRNGDETIDWSWTSKRVHDFVRGITPPSPGARTHFEGRELAILRTALIPKAPAYIGRPGEIVGRAGDAAVVKTGDSTLMIVAAADVDADGNAGPARPPKLRVGDRLGLDLAAEVARLSTRVRRAGPLPYVVLGAGGHGRAVAETLRAAGGTVAAFLDPDRALWNTKVAGTPVVGGDEKLSEYPPARYALAIGVGTVAGSSARRRAHEYAAGAGREAATVVASSAVVAGSARLGRGAQVLAGALIQSGAAVGEGAIVSAGAIVDHDCAVGNHAFVGPGAIVTGGARVGDGAFIEAGAVILQGAEIAGGSRVAAGAVVRGGTK